MEIAWGHNTLTLNVPARQVVASYRQKMPSALADPAEAVRQALEHPIGFPPLRRALTPDDHVAIAVDESLRRPAQLLVPILEHVRSAGIACQAITLLCQPPTTGQPWLEDLPDEFQEVRLEVHDPTERKRLAYLATTRRGRRVYLNRTAIDADQLVLLTRRHYDCLLGYAGGEGNLFPALGDDASLKETAGRLSFDVPGEKPWLVREEALEIGWLLGAPFLVQIIEGPGDDIAEVLAGPIDSSAGQGALDAFWRVTLDARPEVVVAGVSGDASRHTFLDLAKAFACAARVVRSQGRIVVLSDAAPELGRSAEIMKITEDPGQTLLVLAKERPADWEAGFLWAHAAQQAKLYLLSRLPEESAEELFTTPLEQAGQAERVIGEASCVFLPDAHKMMAAAPI